MNEKHRRFLPVQLGHNMASELTVSRQGRNHKTEHSFLVGSRKKSCGSCVRHVSSHDNINADWACEYWKVLHSNGHRFTAIL